MPPRRNLSRLLERAEAGEEIVIGRAGKTDREARPVHALSGPSGSSGDSRARSGSCMAISTPIDEEIARDFEDSVACSLANDEAPARHPCRDLVARRRAVDSRTATRAAIESARARTSASCSIWEIAIKQDKGRLDLPAGLPRCPAYDFAWTSPLTVDHVRVERRTLPVRAPRPVRPDAGGAGDRGTIDDRHRRSAHWRISGVRAPGLTP